MSSAETSFRSPITSSSSFLNLKRNFFHERKFTFQLYLNVPNLLLASDEKSWYQNWLQTFSTNFVPTRLKSSASPRSALGNYTTIKATVTGVTERLMSVFLMYGLNSRMPRELNRANHKEKFCCVDYLQAISYTCITIARLKKIARVAADYCTIFSLLCVISRQKVIKNSPANHPITLLNQSYAKAFFFQCIHPHTEDNLGPLFSRPIFVCLCEL